MSEAQEPKKPKPQFYVGPGTAGHVLTRAYHPCIIANHSDDGPFQKIGSLVPGPDVLTPFVTFKTSEHISTLTLHLRIEHEESSGETSSHIAIIRLNTHAIAHMALHELPDVALDQSDLLQYKNEGDIFYVLAVGPINPNLIAAERLFCDGPDAQHFSVVAQLFRNIKYLYLIIQGTAQTQIDFEALSAQFVNEREEDKIMAWHQNHPGKVMAQLGMFLEKSKRPNPSRFQPTNSFHTFDEYVTVMSFSLLQEQEAEDALVQELQADHLDLRVTTLPKSLDRRYLGFLFLTPQTTIRLSSGDRLKLSFDLEVKDEKEYWSAIIVESVSWAPLNSVTLLITRPFDKDEQGNGTWRKETPFVAADFNEMRNDVQARQLLAKTPCVKVDVKVITSNQVFRRCLAALQKIAAEGSPELKKWFLGSRMDEFPPVDFYASLREKFGDGIEENMLVLSGGQRTAARELKTLRNGLQICQGPPGTGKTEYIKQIAKPFLIDDTGVHQGIITSTTNEGVDQLALAMQALAEKVRPSGKPTPMIIRFHSISTEEEIGLLDAKKARGKPENARPSLVEDDIDVATLDNCVWLNSLFEHVLRCSTYPEPLINDPRLKELRLSLGVRMLQVAGMPGFECEYSELQRWEMVRNMYCEYKANRNWLPEQMELFKAAMKELRSYTLSPDKEKVKVTIIVCTVANIATPSLYTNATKVEFFLLDEVSRITEPELWPMFAHYPDTPCHVLVGDPQQLAPQILSTWTNNCFAEQLEVSLFSRFFHGGHAYSFFNEQHRAVQPIGDFISRVFYKDKVQNAEICRLDHPSRDIARRISEFNKEVYKKYSTIMFLDNLGGVAKQSDIGKSTYNISNCAVGMNLAVTLVENGFDASGITLLTPYTAQRRYYMAAVDRAHAMHPNLGLRNITVAVIDGYQGRENHIVLLDWTVVGSPGFMREFGRLCVAHSRARDGLYVIGNQVELEKNKKVNMRVFKKLIGREGLATVRWYLKGEQESRYVSEDMVDVSMEVDTGNANEDADAMDVGGNTAEGVTGNWAGDSADAGAVTGGAPKW